MTVHPHVANREQRTDHFPTDLSYALARGRDRKGDKGIKEEKEGGWTERERERMNCGKLLSTASVI